MSSGLVKRSSLVVACAIAVLVGGCSRDEHSDKDSQVVATVNDREITISQLRQALYTAGAGNVSPATTRQAIDSLVNQELLVQRALETKLDRDPAVVHALESARRQVLARAYAERNIFPKDEISNSEKQQYFRANPALFEQRKVYRVTAFSIQMEDLNQALRNELEQAHSQEQVRGVLSRHEVPFEASQVSLAAEDLPMDMLPQFSKATPGDVLVMPRSDGGASLLSLMSVTDSPLDFAQASGRIGQYLTATRNQQTIEDYLKKAKATAKISISGDPTASIKTASAPDEHLANGVKGL
jgi:EpsD family peptidyl-prolyl cis-trans isomerase